MVRCCARRRSGDFPGGGFSAGHISVMGGGGVAMVEERGGLVLSQGASRTTQAEAGHYGGLCQGAADLHFGSSASVWCWGWRESFSCLGVSKGRACRQGWFCGV